jgi:NADH-quinone oxidoreductase subunit D
MGYMHRGYEKLTEVRTYPQVTTLVNRIDWLGSFANEVPFILAAEQLMEVEAPPRAQWIRTILFELSRIANITLFLGDMACSSAPDPGLLRLPRPRVRPQPDRGGHRRALPPQLRPHRRPQGRPAQGLDRRDQAAMEDARPSATDGDLVYRQRDLPGPHPRHRRHPGRRRLSYGLSGANLRGSGVDWDLRRDAPSGLAYDQLDWKVWTHPDGDSFARFWVRSRRPARPPASSTSSSTACPAGRSWPRCPASSRCPRARPTSPPRTRSARWATTSSPRATGAVPGQDPLGVSFNNISIAAVGAQGRLRARHHHHPGQPLLHPGDIDR